MKRSIILSAIAVLTISFILTACNTEEQYPHETIDFPLVDQVHDLSSEDNGEQAHYAQPDATAFTIADALNDFDYMIRLMQDTFPFFGVAIRNPGAFPFRVDERGILQTAQPRAESIDILALADKTRIIIENYPYSLQVLADDLGIAFGDMPEFDEHIFWSIVTHEFFSHFFMFGHLFSVDFSGFNHISARYRQASRSRNPLTWLNSQVTLRQESINFYREQEILFNTLLEEDLALFQFIFRAMPPQDDKVLPPLLTTEIIEEGSIAYFNIRTFSLPPSFLRSELISFYEQIQDYDHLIIDIRDGPGGILNVARMTIMYPLWADRDNMPDMPLFSFHVGSERGHALAGYHFAERAQESENIPQSGELLTVDEILLMYELPYLNKDDIQNLAHGMRLNTSLANITTSHLANFGLFRMEQVPFNGQIWLLTSEINASSGAMFARLAKHMGFATLVGEQVAGAYTSTWLSFFSMPNSGIVLQWDIDYLTDEFGRALNEFPTEPHYFNREGMDALQTALALIAEGNYHRE